MEEPKDNSKFFMYAFFVLVVILIGIGGYFLGKYTSNKTEEPTSNIPAGKPAPEQVPTPSEPTEEPTVEPVTLKSGYLTNASSEIIRLYNRSNNGFRLDVSDENGVTWYVGTYTINENDVVFTAAASYNTGGFYNTKPNVDFKGIINGDTISLTVFNKTYTLNYNSTLKETAQELKTYITNPTGIVGEFSDCTNGC